MSPIGVLVMAYGGPRNLEEVEPYLLDVRGGRPTPAEMVRDVRERYRKIGGRSPILERTRAQAEALERALNSREGGPFRVFVGMRHWHPYIHETMREMKAAGIGRAVGLVMAPHYSRMSVGAYIGKVNDAGAPELKVVCIESWHLLPGYLDAVIERVQQALARFPPEQRADLPILFTAHSLPRRIREWGDPYEHQLGATVAALSARLGAAGPPGGPSRCHFAFQSAAMTPEPWLGPDAGELISRFAAEKKAGLVFAPIGFVSEHVEILYDIDIVFREQAERLGLRLERIDMVQAAPSLIQGLAERVRGEAEARDWLNTRGGAP